MINAFQIADRRIDQERTISLGNTVLKQPQRPDIWGK
jgi:hypothetical protein